MSTPIDADLLQPDRVTDTPPPEPAAEEPPAEEAAVERDVESDTLEIPDSSVEGGTVKYVPASALAGARGELKELKAKLADATEGSAKAQQLEQQIARLSGEMQQLAAKAQAYDAAVAAQQRQPEPKAEDDTEAVELAQVLDLYTPEGKPDVVKARKAMSVMGKLAKAEAQQSVAPLAHNAVTQQSQMMLARAKNTAAPNGSRPDPTVLEQIWGRLDPQLTATAEGAKQAWVAALGYTKAVEQAQGQQPRQRTATGQFTKGEDIPPPLHTERAGGKDIDTGPPLSEAERKYLKDAGITEKEYHESAKSAPWLRR